MEDKFKIFGKHVIINKGDFKGVTGILKSVTIDKDCIEIRGSDKSIRFNQKNDIYCNIIVNNDNTIKVLLDYVTKV